MYQINFKMKNQILEYYKSEHFLFTQWDRKIEDKLLYRILPFITKSIRAKKIAIVTPTFLQEKGLLESAKNCLVVVINKKQLTTVYWCDHTHYLFTREKETEFQIIN